MVTAWIVCGQAKQVIIALNRGSRLGNSSRGLVRNKDLRVIELAWALQLNHSATEIGIGRNAVGNQELAGELQSVHQHEHQVDVTNQRAYFDDEFLVLDEGDSARSTTICSESWFLC